MHEQKLCMRTLDANSEIKYTPHTYTHTIIQILYTSYVKKSIDYKSKSLLLDCQFYSVGQYVSDILSISVCLHCFCLCILFIEVRSLS